uniref:Uncharacterized protein n=1 Tax=Anopheles minimus TaxID=112268 RepID=A0A182W242_9DIPT
MEKGKVTISQNFTDNRQVVEVCGRHIVLSSILSEVENAISNDNNIEEIRFIAGTIFKVDANLEKGVWHGRNIVVYAKELQICQSVHWNVSGKDGCEKYTQNAGSSKNGIGLNGKDGEAGESGGNVMIIAKVIKCSENLTITANGGNGSKGQDGGNGAPGKDGKGISTSNFDSLFPPAASVNVKSANNVSKLKRKELTKRNLLHNKLLKKKNVYKSSKLKTKKLMKHNKLLK